MQPNARDPSTLGLEETSRRNQEVEVCIELQVSTESVRNNDDEHSDAVLHFYPLLNHVSAKNWQVVEEMAVSFEETPELPWHRKDDSCVRNVRKRCLLLFQPKKRGSIPATGAESRFAPVVAPLFFSVRGV
jgi:hypothetical protein